MKLNIQTTGMTDTGKVRDGNEDAFFAGQLADGRWVLALVVDGCGGYRGGAKAAKMTRNAIRRHLQPLDAGNAAENLKQAVIAANNKVHEERFNHPQFKRMCCVATAILVDRQEKVMHMAHVGDSRLYVCHDRRIIKLSHDHSPVGREEEIGVLTETEAMNHPCRNVIERSIGVKRLDSDTEYIEIRTFPLTGGLKILLCSDGLCDMITSAQINDIVRLEIPLEETARKLVEAANEAGGRDNITVVLLRTEGEDTEKALDRMNHYAAMLKPQ